MTTQPDIVWNEQCLGIRISEQICTYLKKHDAEYQRLQKKILELIERYPVIETFMESNQSISLTAEEHKAVHRYFQLESGKEMIEEEYHFYMGQAQMISYGAMLGKIKKAVTRKDNGDTEKLLKLLMDTWIDEVEDQLKENTVYQEMLEKISKYEEQVRAMGLSKEKRKMIDAYVTEVSERWILYAESLYQAGMQKILELLNL
jgi:predicted patatin/cPLA2 family phospholipase